MESELLTAIFAILVLIVLSGFFSGSETSLTATSASNMHKLAKEGVKFTNAYTTGSVCTPTRYALMTGQ